MISVVAAYNLGSMNTTFSWQILLSVNVNYRHRAQRKKGSTDELTKIW